MWALTEDTSETNPPPYPLFFYNSGEENLPLTDETSRLKVGGRLRRAATVRGQRRRSNGRQVGWVTERRHGAPSPSVPVERYRMTTWTRTRGAVLKLLGSENDSVLVCFTPESGSAPLSEQTEQNWDPVCLWSQVLVPRKWGMNRLQPLMGRRRHNTFVYKCIIVPFLLEVLAGNL